MQLHRLKPTLVSGGVLFLLVIALLAWQGMDQGNRDDASSRRSDLDAALRAQLAELSADGADQTAWVQAFGPGSKQLGTDVWSAREALGVTEARFAVVSFPDAPDRDDGTHSALIRVTWSSDGAMAGTQDVLGSGEPTQATIVARVRASQDSTERVDLVDFEARVSDGVNDPVPPWLLAPVEVTDQGQVATTILIGGPDADPVLDQLPAVVQTGVHQVTATLPVSGRAIVMVTSSAEDAAALLGRSASQIGTLAGVTTMLPGVSVPVVVLNGDVMAAQMDDRGRQVVVTHELTHALTGALSGGSAEPWVVEGFADWVAWRAVASADDPPVVSIAGDLFADIASGDIPQALPSATELADAQSSSAAYQGAWIAMVVLERDYGPDSVMALYRSVLGGSSVQAALQQIGTSVDELTATWRDYLTYNASTVS